MPEVIMSTSTTNYGFIKPDLGEPSGSEEIASNIQLSDHVLNRIAGSTSVGRENKLMTAWKRTTALSGNAANTTVGDDSTWTRLYTAATYTEIMRLDYFGEYGVNFTDNSGYWEFLVPGYYRINWNIRLQMSAATMTEGYIRTALVHYDTTSPQTKHVKNSFVIQAMDTFSGITDVGNEIVVKATLADDDSGDIQVSGATNQYPYSGAPYNGYCIAFAHNSSTAATASIVTSETYYCIEWLRSL
jgi:hypothetical protein